MRKNIFRSYILPYFISSLFIVLCGFLISRFVIPEIEKLGDDEYITSIYPVLCVLISTLVSYFCLYLPYLQELTEGIVRRGREQGPEFIVFLGYFILMLTISQDDILPIVVIYILTSSLYIYSIYRDVNRKKDMQAEEKMEIKELPQSLVPNNKIILINGQIDRGQIKEIIKDFSNIYDENLSLKTIRIQKSDNKGYVLTFPQDINLNHFSNLIYYLTYPEYRERLEVIGWYDITPESGKPEMFFISKDDRKYNNVYFVNADNDVYEMELSRMKYNKIKQIGKHYIDLPAKYLELSNDEDDIILKFA